MRAILTLNAGSSSVKFAAFSVEGGDAALWSGQIEGIGADAPAASLNMPDGPANLPPIPNMARDHAALIGWLLETALTDLPADLVAIGHRVVHGGLDFSDPVRIDAEVMARLETLVPLARTHQPHNLAAVKAVARIWPDVPQIACFDTTFHRTIPENRQRYAIPEHLTALGVRRYGFHGLSYQWIAARMPATLGPRAMGRVIAAHLGNGASLCGMLGRRSRATTMGFTPLDGLVMGARPGLLDPGAVLFLFEELGMSVAEVHNLLFNQCGLRGVSGLTNDMRALLASDNLAAARAVEMFCERAVREIGSVAAALGGLDALVFTGGIGERSAAIRARIVEGCGWLGAALDVGANAADGPRISPEGSAVEVVVIPTNEEAVIAGAVRTFLD